MKILVIRFSSLGDVVLTAPVFHRLRQWFPDAWIAVAVKEEFADVLAGNGDINERLTLKRGESLSAYIRHVREKEFDLVIDLHATLRSWIVSACSGAKRVLRYRKDILARRLYVRWRKSSASLERHTLDRYMEALAPLAAPRSVLVIQTAFLGDAVLTTPLLTALKERHPGAPISMLCTPQIADVFHGHPAVQDIILFDKHGREKSWASRWTLAQRLKERHFDLAVVPHRSMTSALLAWAAGIPRRVGFSTSQGRWLLTDTVPFQWGVHDVDRNLALLQPLGKPATAAELSIKPDTDAARIISARFRAAGVAPSDKVIGINAGSVWATKRWLSEGFAAVADRAMQESGVKILFIGGKKDKPVVDDVIARMQSKAINWAGETSLKELIAAIARCDVFLTNDSGPMHIAVACQVPTVAIFGPTTKELGFFPYGPEHTVIEKSLPCRPCGLHGADRCPLGHFECMRSITPDEVFRAVQAMLERAPHSTRAVAP